MIQMVFRPPRMNYYQRLKWNLFLFMLMVVCLPLPIVAGTIYRYYQTYVRTTVEQNLKAVVEKRRTAIEVFLSERVAYLQTLAHIRCVNPRSGQRGLEYLFSVVKPLSDSFVDMGMIDHRGRQIAYVGPFDLKGKDYSDSLWFQQVRKSGVYISDVFLGFRHIPHLAIAVRGAGDGPPWYLRATINTETFKRLISSGQVGAIRDAYLYKSDKTLQLHQGGSKPIDPATITLPRPGEISVGTVTTVDGHRMLTAVGWLNHNRWLLLVAEDPTSEFVSLYQARRVGLFLFFIAVVVIGAITFYAAHWIVRKIQVADRQKDMIQEHMSRTGKLVSLGKMAAGLAHEINNPLAIISESAGYAKEVMDMAEAQGRPLTPEQRREIYTALDDIIKESFRGKDITQQLLGFARGPDAKIMEVDINKLVGELLKSYARILTKTGKVRVVDRFDRNMPIIKTDPSQLQQVLINLIDNAIHFTKERGGLITLSTEAHADHVLIKVTDDGPGIPENIKKRLFDPFFTTKPVGQGTGLGLAICYGIVKKLGGEIFVESGEEGKGSTFTVKLPHSPPLEEVPS